MFLPHFDVFSDLLLNRRTATWNLFVLYIAKGQLLKLLYKKLFFSESFNITRKPAFDHFHRHNEKAIQNEAISLVVMRRKEL